MSTYAWIKHGLLLIGWYLFGNLISLMKYTWVLESWKQHSTKKQLYSNFPPNSQTIQIKWARQTAGEIRANSYVTPPTYQYTTVSWTAKTYIHQLCVDTRCRLEELPRLTDSQREKESQWNPYCWSTLMIIWWWDISLPVGQH